MLNMEFWQSAKFIKYVPLFFTGLHQHSKRRFGWERRRMVDMMAMNVN